MSRVPVAWPMSGPGGVLVLSGGPEALPDLLATGLAYNHGVVLAGDVTSAAGAQLVAGGAGWLRTDTLRHRLNSFGDVRRNVGPTAPASDPLSERVVPDFLPVTGVQHQTTSVLTGAASVTASSSAADPADPGRYDLAAAPVAAFDGDPATAWLSGPLRPGGTPWVQATWPYPVGPGTVRVDLPNDAQLDAVAEHVLVHTDSASVGVDVPAGATSVTVRLTVATRTVRVDVDRVVASGYDPRVSIADVTVTGAPAAAQVLVPPDDAPPTLDRAAPAAILLSRSPTSVPDCFPVDGRALCPTSSGRAGEEARGLDRYVDLVAADEWTLTGTAVVVGGSGEVHLGGGLYSMRPFDLPCGSGPPLSVGGVAIPTAASGDSDRIARTGRLDWHACGDVLLGAGRSHILAAGDGPVAVDTLLAQPAGGHSVTSRPSAARSVRVLDWTDASRTIAVSAGGSALLTVPENANDGWTATVDGAPLQPLRADGWAQGWVLPPGGARTVVLTFEPEGTYHWALLLGLLLVVVLVLLAAVPARRTALGDSRLVDAPASSAVAGHRWADAGWLAPVAGFVVGWLLAGWAGAAVLGAGAAAGRFRRGPGWVPAAVAGGALATAGLLGALAPWPSLSPALAGSPTQLLCLVAVGAVLAGGGTAVGGPQRRRLDQPPRDGRDGHADDAGEHEDKPEATRELGGAGDPEHQLDDQQVPQEDRVRPPTEGSRGA